MSVFGSAMIQPFDRSTLLPPTTRRSLLAGHQASLLFASHWCRIANGIEESSPVPGVARSTRRFLPRLQIVRGLQEFAATLHQPPARQQFAPVAEPRSQLCSAVAIALEEDAKFKQFRDKGIDPELESKMDELFGGHVARGDDIITPNMDPLPTPMEENEDMVYIPSQPDSENNINQLFNIENNGTSNLGPGVSAWQELWHDNSPVSTPPPLSQGVDGGGNRKGKRKLENLSMDPNKSAKTNGPKRMRSAAMMYEKLDAMLEVIISEKKAREVEREERREIRQRKEMNNKNGSGDNGAPSVPDALAKICALPHFDPLHPASCSFVDLDS
ncbi:LOW QUALITY PROTEIN: hypothetical protein Cgig2_026137 [Carnegiea gigantea]|uniref:Uncharacterized protein n=1 Tax=Carnegiea gigantea TaxID=171969 RepID=A0A9Q1Q8G0_9CARY|nr:LOW QUALITY PROTEIN: hypothetical protein Cgig2_026137 [Carnegiea gigantea]